MGFPFFGCPGAVHIAPGVCWSGGLPYCYGENRVCFRFCEFLTTNVFELVLVAYVPVDLTAKFYLVPRDNNPG